MKKILRCRVTIFLILGWALLSSIGYIGKDTIYKVYKLNLKKTPSFVMVLQGVRDGVYPWRREEQAFKVFLPEEEMVATETVLIPETEEKDEIPETKGFVQVDESYFDDAVFIGDSRTVGLRDYGGLDGATFYATVGLNVYDMWKGDFCEVAGKKVTLEAALRARRFQKVYFQIGINEMGRGTVDDFMQAYTQSVARIRELQPDAIIYVQGIMRVAKARSDTDPIFNNPGVQIRNERIAQLADNQIVFYIDVNEVVCDDTGNLKAELTFDNLHLYGSKYDIWVDFLMKHGVV